MSDLDGMVQAEFDKTLRRMRGFARALALPFPDPPEYEAPVFPEDLSELSDEHLGMHLTYWTGLCAYARVQAAVLDGLSGIAEQAADDEFALRYYLLDDKHVTNKRHHAEADKRVRAQRAKQRRFKADSLLVSSLVAGYERRYSAISRGISRRAAERGRGG